MKQKIFFIFLSLFPTAAYSCRDAHANQALLTEKQVTAPAPCNTYPKLPYKELIIKPNSLTDSHSSCIVELPNGELFTTWYSSGPPGSSGESAIWGSRRPPGASEWTPPEIIHDTPGVNDGNAVLYLGEDRKLWLFWSIREKNKKQSKLRVKVSEDFGHTWGEARDFGTPRGYMPRTHPKTLHNGWILLPLYVDWSSSSVAVLSKDGGLSWERPRFILPFFGTQPTVIQRSDLSLFALMRSSLPQRKSWQAVSKDFGKSWQGWGASELKNPSSSLEMVKLHDGAVVLAFNNTQKGRANLSLALSHDDGKSWPRIQAIENNPQSAYEYPSIIQDRCGLIHVTYTYDNRKSIAHYVTDEKIIESQPEQKVNP